MSHKIDHSSHAITAHGMAIMPFRAPMDPYLRDAVFAKCMTVRA
jgi:hypothetical protein